MKDSTRKIISRIDGVAGAVDRLADQALDHEKGLIRIETVIEMAQARGVAARGGGWGSAESIRDLRVV